MNRTLPHETTWGPPLFAAILCLITTMLVGGGLVDAERGRLAASFHPGLAVFVLPAGCLAILSLGLNGWGRSARRRRAALVGALLALGMLLVLMVAVAVASREANRCINGPCDGAAFPDLAQRAFIALLMLPIDLVGVSLLTLNALEDAFPRPTGGPEREAGERRA